MGRLKRSRAHVDTRGVLPDAVPTLALRRFLAAGAALACALWALPLPRDAVASVPDSDAVREAEQELEEARQRFAEADALADDLSADLDAYAEQFERANAHRLRLEEEAGELAEHAREERDRVVEAEDAFARQVAGTYMMPTVEVAMAEAMLLAPDASTALHRASLLGRLASRGRQRADRAERRAALAEDERRQQQVVQAGATAAAQDAERRAGELRLALEVATERVEASRRELDRVRAEHQEVVERERWLAEIAARGAGPLPPVDGKVCPIGAPNGFIDSWGYPRSGGRRHKGVDMFAAYGMPLYAVADGVVEVGHNRLGGLSINLYDDWGDRYYYAHLSAAVVTSGQRVRAGDVIGANGNSGNARTTPPHLHWQYHPGNGPPVNPYPLARALCR